MHFKFTKEKNIMRDKAVLEIQRITKMSIETKEVWELTAAMDCILEVKSPYI